jgi:hypothetical protein
VWLLQAKSATLFRYNNTASALILKYKHSGHSPAVPTCVRTYSTVRALISYTVQAESAKFNAIDPRDVGSAAAFIAALPSDKLKLMLEEKNIEVRFVFFPLAFLNNIHFVSSTILPPLTLLFRDLAYQIPFEIQGPDNIAKTIAKIIPF